MIRNVLALGGLAGLALLSAAGLQAYDRFDGAPPPRIAVSYVGLDLATPEGIGMLETRINRAIAEICPDDTGSAVRWTRSTRQCREDAIASVRPQVDRAVADAEERQSYGMRDHYADDDRYREHRYDGRGHADRIGDRPPPAPPVRHGPPGPDARHAMVPPPPPPTTAPPAPIPPGARLIRRTVTTTVTTSGDSSAAPTVLERRVVVKDSIAPPKKAWRPTRRVAPAFARRPAVAGSWLPPVAWAASDRAIQRAFRTGKLARWNLTDRNGIARAGYVSVSTPRWLGSCACRNVQVVKYNGRSQIVVASGMRCLSGRGLVNRAL